MTAPFSQVATAFFYSPLPCGRVDLSQGCINTPVLPGTVDVRVDCQVIHASGAAAPFSVVCPSSFTQADAELAQLGAVIANTSLNTQWYSPHARSVLARYMQWALWQDQLHCELKVVQPPMRWAPTLSFLDPVQELNSPAFMALQDRQAWTPLKVLQLFPTFRPEAFDASAWPLVDPWVAATIWHNLSKFLHTHSKCPNLVT